MAGIYNEIETQRERAKKALVEGRYDDAILQAELSLIDLALIPDGQKEGDAGARMEWNREAILAFIELVKAKRSDDSHSLNPMGMTTHPMQGMSERPMRGGCYRG